MDSTHPTRERSRALLAASLALALFWSGSSHARTQPETDCTDVAKRLQSLETPADVLATTPIDHEHCHLRFNFKHLITRIKETAIMLIRSGLAFHGEY